MVIIPSMTSTEELPFYFIVLLMMMIIIVILMKIIVIFICAFPQPTHKKKLN